MLQFFKKSGRTESGEKIPDEMKEKVSVPLSPSSYLPSALDISDEKVDDQEFTDSRSRLSKNLIEIISDKNCICYFVQFLETKSALSLIKFYLDTENFKTVTKQTLRKFKNHSIDKKSLRNDEEKIVEKHDNDDDDDCDKDLNFFSLSLECDDNNSTKIAQNNLHYQSKNDKEDLKNTKTKCINYTKKYEDDSNDMNSVGIEQEIGNDNVAGDDNYNDVVVPELKSLCDLSMRKPLTDDEKSRIYAETSKRNKQQQQQQQQIKNDDSKKIRNNSTSSLSSTSSSSRKFNSSVATDAFRIYKKYLTLNSQYFIDIPATITSNISLALCGVQNYDDYNDMITTTTTVECSTIDHTSEIDETMNTKSISSNCFEEAKQYVFERMEKEYLNEFLESTFYCKYCLDILINSKLKLSDILYNESAIFYFMEYLEQEKQHLYLEFWMAAINFRKHYLKYSNDNRCDIDVDDDDDEDGDGDDSNISKENIKNDHNRNIKEAQNDAMILYEKYFSLQAINRLQLITNNVRCKIEEMICSNDQLQISKCFDIPLRLIEIYLERNYFEKFLKSQLFTNYLNELRNKLKDDLQLSSSIHSASNTTRKLLTPSLSLSKRHHQNQQQQRGHRKTLSDCTNENTKYLRNNDGSNNFFISQHNTLLAMESNTHSNRFKILNNFNHKTSTAITPTTPITAEYMQIETKYLTNPDLLWHRNSIGTTAGLAATTQPGFIPHTSNGAGSTSSSSGLTFGRVDSLGRYERDFDLTEIYDHKEKWYGGNKIKNAVRKLVNLPEEKVQEEIAWQVAELIVKDITSITLGDNYNTALSNRNNQINDYDENL